MRIKKSRKFHGDVGKPVRMKDVASFLKDSQGEHGKLVYVKLEALVDIPEPKQKSRRS